VPPVWRPLCRSPSKPLALSPLCRPLALSRSEDFRHSLHLRLGWSALRLCCHHFRASCLRLFCEHCMQRRCPTDIPAHCPFRRRLRGAVDTCYCNGWQAPLPASCVVLLGWHAPLVPGVCLLFKPRWSCDLLSSRGRKRRRSRRRPRCKRRHTCKPYRCSRGRLGRLRYRCRCRCRWRWRRRKRGRWKLGCR